jgi:hypothetical protein
VAKTSKFTVNYLFIIKRLDYRKANVFPGRRKLGAPKRPVAALIGDGSFLKTRWSKETAGRS